MIFLRCRDAIRAWSESQDHEIGAMLRLKMWAHCLVCRPCTKGRSQIAELRKAARGASLDGGNPTGGELSPEARTRIRETLKNTKPE